MNLPENVDKPRLEYLLGRVVDKEITRQEANELLPMLEDIPSAGVLRIGLSIFIRRAKNDNDNLQVVTNEM